MELLRRLGLLNPESAGGPPGRAALSDPQRERATASAAVRGFVVISSSDVHKNQLAHTTPSHIGTYTLNNLNLNRMEKITAAVLTVIGALLVTAVVSETIERTSVSPTGLQYTSSNTSTLSEDKGNNTENNKTTIVAANPISSSSTPTKAVQSPQNETSTNNTASPTSVTRTTPSKTTAHTVTSGPNTAISSSPPVSQTVKKPQTEKTSPSEPATIQQTTSTPENSSSSRITYIIIFIIVIVCLIAAIVYCCVQNKTRRFSLEHSKNEDAQIPLSAVEPEVFEASPPKDMQTFNAAESSMPANSAPPADGAEKQEGEKAATEPNQQEKESSAGTQTTLPLSEKPSELTVVDLSDGDPAISTKTSVESLDVPLNENNSNNRAQANMHEFSGDFTEICLDDGL
ncbi:hypothetical protein MHYP_G00043920 [Metynnis hypsauchen]